MDDNHDQENDNTALVGGVFHFSCFKAFYNQETCDHAYGLVDNFFEEAHHFSRGLVDYLNSIFNLVEHKQNHS